MKIIFSNRFKKIKKKSTHKMQREIDKQIKIIEENPEIGNLKKGELHNIHVYKFKFDRQLFLISYEIIEDVLYLYSIGSHENFYKKLKQYLR